MLQPNATDEIRSNFIDETSTIEIATSFFT